MKPATTLLVEDDPHVAAVYARLFADDGMELEVASDWDAAVARFRVVGHSLVIADYNLTGERHGLHLLIALKRLVPSSRMVLISGAMSLRAEKLASEIPYIDGFYAKGPDCGDQLLELARLEAERSARQTDWRDVANGYLQDPGVDSPTLDKIDDELRADVARRRGR